MTAPVVSERGNDPNPTTAVYTPVIDVAFGSITASYTTFTKIVASSAILVLSNYTDVLVDYTLSGGISTQGHLSAGSTIEMDFKSNLVTGRGDTSIGFKANSTLPSSGLCSVTNIALS